MIKSQTQKARRRLSWTRIRSVVEYGLPLILLVVLLYKVIGGIVWGDIPRPQIPPNGYLAQETRVILHWSRGDHEGPFKLQVLADGDDFDDAKGNALIVDHTVTETMYRLPQLQPGKKYCWRVIEDNGIVSCFRTSDSLITY